LADSQTQLTSPSCSHDWAARYARHSTPWDLGEPHPELIARLKLDPTLNTGQLGRVLVPGCGFGWDAIALANAGWDVVGLDLVAELEDAIGAQLLGVGAQLLIGDFFNHQPAERYDLIFDHTFFCALPLNQRKAWGSKIAALCTPTAQVVSLVFPENRPLDEGGPPFGMCTLDVESALGDHFELLQDQDAAPSQGRWWPEKWAQLRHIGV